MGGSDRNSGAGKGSDVHAIENGKGYERNQQLFTEHESAMNQTTWMQGQRGIRVFTDRDRRRIRRGRGRGRTREASDGRCNRIKNESVYNPMQQNPFGL